LAVSVALPVPGLGRDVDERGLIAARGEMAIDGVMAQVRPTSRKPSRKQRMAVVEHLRKGRVPIDDERFLAPESVPIIQRATVSFSVTGHGPSSSRLVSHSTAVRLRSTLRRIKHLFKKNRLHHRGTESTE